jgi:hypothetical protein
MPWYFLTVSYQCVKTLIREPFYSAHELVTISASLFLTFQYAGIPLWCHKFKLKEYLLFIIAKSGSNYVTVSFIPHQDCTSTS